MSALREAIVLPLLLLTVTLLGGLRIAGDIRFAVPPLSALLLAMLLLGALVRSRVLAPEALMHTDRSPLENSSGLIVLLALFAASAQTFNLLTPDRGLLHAIFTVFFAIQLLTTIAAIRDRTAMLRSLLVMFGAVFALRFVVLENLYASGGGLLSRVFTAAMEGVTLGALDYDAHAPATGYIGFVTLALYVSALVLLAPPRRDPPNALSPRPRQSYDLQ